MRNHTAGVTGQTNGPRMLVCEGVREEIGYREAAAFITTQMSRS